MRENTSRTRIEGGVIHLREERSDVVFFEVDDGDGSPSNVLFHELHSSALQASRIGLKLVLHTGTPIARVSSLIGVRQQRLVS